MVAIDLMRLERALDEQAVVLEEAERDRAQAYAELAEAREGVYRVPKEQQAALDDPRRVPSRACPRSL